MVQRATSFVFKENNEVPAILMILPIVFLVSVITIFVISVIVILNKEDSNQFQSTFFQEVYQCWELDDYDFCYVREFRPYTTLNHSVVCLPDLPQSCIPYEVFLLSGSDDSAFRVTLSD